MPLLTIDPNQRLKKQIERQNAEAEVFWAKQREQDARIKAIEDEVERRERYVDQEVERRVNIERQRLGIEPN